VKIKIEHRYGRAVLFAIEAGSLRLAVEAALKSEADLSWANLRWADLSEANLSLANLSEADLSLANLRWADLSEADLSKADLRWANLSEANLRWADLSWANLRWADLSKADLSKANLSEANLSKADLSGANLRWADLSKADLRWANLSEANLSWANLSKADLSGANLRWADLSKADLSWGNLTPIRDDLWAVLSAVPSEAHGLRQALLAGKVDGSAYEGECACLVGTVANLKQCPYTAMPLLKPNSSRPIERFFLNIRPGDIPGNSLAAQLVLEWIDMWLANMCAFAAELSETQKGGLPME
jgi:uncharacterized protein YjbI with pentapeptide repeats